ncbi:MAG: hypothetical protein MUE60_06215 [Candidatus Eisenbacteria bacterium]|jgi:hypothetical protein|nr:hypothetical protein [Candidatus Eisenbacteria bacterium]
MRRLMVWILGMDRRIIFLLLALALVLPLLFPVKLPVRVTPEVKKVYDMVDGLQPGDVILIDMDYGPDTMAELEPMSYSIMRHVFDRGARFVSTCLSATGVSLIESEIRHIAQEKGKTYGEDYVFLGYRPYPASVILSMGQNMRQSFPIDFYNNPLDSLPLMRGIRNYADLRFVMSVSSTSGVDYWIMYGHERYNFPLALGVTAVMAADYYNYLQSGQIEGILGGLKGAAEYETLLGQGDRAIIWMNIQSVCHVLIVALIVVGNIAYLATRKRGV